MMQIEFSASNNPENWITSIAEQLKVPVKNNSFYLPSSVGEGIVKHYYPIPGLTLSYLHLQVNKPLSFIRKPVESSLLIPIMFFSQEMSLQQDVDNQQKLIGYHTSNGIFMPSSQVGARWMIPAHQWFYNVTITFRIDWLLNNLTGKEDTYLHKLLKSNEPFYLFESLSPGMLQVIESIDKIMKGESKIQHLILHQKTLELLILFLQKIEKRSILKNTARLHTNDIESIFQIRKCILESLPDTPSVNKLASDAGMSVSKLQKCFKQVFGKSIIQYALSEKMQSAKRLLDTNKYSVSEVGYLIGYSNLSHFSEAFKSEFGINPKAYLLSIL